MSGPPPALAAVRVAVRVALADLPGDARVLVALSGGADSLALLAASLHERPGRTAAAVVDHGWSPDSAGRAAEVAAVAGLAGADPVAVLTVPVTTGEAAAREERYRALTAEAGRQRAAV
ncbi:MAG: ATP-binding protein, partial [Mycobacteriales bacterium]